MPLATNKELLTLARKGGYAVGAFNINNLEILQAIVSAGEAERSPAIIAVSEGAIQYAGMPYLISMVRTAAAQSSIPISLHLDHGKDLEVIGSCIDHGFTSVMIDGSEFEFEKNIEVTKKVVEMAKKKGVSVEGELGRLKGIEEKISVSEKEAFLTDPQAAEDFVAFIIGPQGQAILQAAHQPVLAQPEADNYTALPAALQALSIPRP